MATRETAAKKTAVPAKKTVAKTSALTRTVTGNKAPATKMTKTQVIRYMAEQMEVPPKA